MVTLQPAIYLTPRLYTNPSLQQIWQFERQREEIVMHPRPIDYTHMAEVKEALEETLIELMSVEDRLRGLSAAQRLRGLTPEQILECVPPEELLQRLTRKQRAQLRDLLEQESPN